MVKVSQYFASACQQLLICWQWALSHVSSCHFPTMVYSRAFKVVGTDTTSVAFNSDATASV